jgi:hypothetical protein
MLAPAPGNGLGFADFDLRRRQASAFVGAITKRLRLGAPARTPPIRAGLGFLDEGGSLKNNRLAHKRNG